MWSRPTEPSWSGRKTGWGPSTSREKIRVQDGRWPYAPVDLRRAPRCPTPSNQCYSWSPKLHRYPSVGFPSLPHPHAHTYTTTHSPFPRKDQNKFISSNTLSIVDDRNDLLLFSPFLLRSQPVPFSSQSAVRKIYHTSPFPPLPGLTHSTRYVRERPHLPGYRSHQYMSRSHLFVPSSTTEYPGTTHSTTHGPLPNHLSPDAPPHPRQTRFSTLTVSQP